MHTLRTQALLALLGSLGCFVFSIYLAFDVYDGYHEAENRVLEVQQEAIKTRAKYQKSVEDFTRKIQESERTYTTQHERLRALEKAYNTVEREHTLLRDSVRSIRREFDRHDSDAKRAEQSFQDRRAMYEHTLDDVEFDDDGTMKARDSFMNRFCGLAERVFNDLSICKQGKEAEARLKVLFQTYEDARALRSKASESLEDNERKLRDVQTKLKGLTHPRAQREALERLEHDMRKLERDRDAYLRMMRAKHGPILDPETDLSKPIQGATIAEFFTVWHWLDALMLWVLSLALGGLMAIRAGQFLGWTSFYIVGNGPQTPRSAHEVETS